MVATGRVWLLVKVRKISHAPFFFFCLIVNNTGKKWVLNTITDFIKDTHTFRPGVPDYQRPVRQERYLRVLVNYWYQVFVYLLFLYDRTAVVKKMFFLLTNPSNAFILQVCVQEQRGSVWESAATDWHQVRVSSESGWEKWAWFGMILFFCKSVTWWSSVSDVGVLMDKWLCSGKIYWRVGIVCPPPVALWLRHTCHLMYLLHI